MSEDLEPTVVEDEFGRVELSPTPVHQPARQQRLRPLG